MRSLFTNFCALLAVVAEPVAAVAVADSSGLRVDENSFAFVYAKAVAEDIAAPEAPIVDSSFRLNKDKEAFTFEYSASQPDESNWIGIYHSGKGPANGQKVENSLLWDWAPGSEGELYLDATTLGAGNFDAYFLAKGGYESLASSFPVTAPINFFPAKPVTLRNGRVGDEYEASVGGLVGGSSATFSMSSVQGGDWASISEVGVITGRPTEAGTTTVKVTASSGNSIASLDFHIRIAESNSPLVSELTVMTWNLWHQGTQVQGYHAKQVAFLSESNVDIVGLQESHAARSKALADALGWNYYHGNESHGILTRYAIDDTYGDITRGVGARIGLGDKSVNIWNLHLGYTPYGPYDFCFEGLTDEQVLANEAKSGRTPQVQNAMKQMSPHLHEADTTPVLLTGDFNAPSHLDWIEDNKDTHCGKTFDWPTSKEPEKAGLIDSLRQVHPDPTADPHITWSPIFLKNPDYGNKDEPLDRIDFVYHKGRALKPTAADTVVTGEPKPQPDHKYNEWTSDHSAVIVTFDLNS